MSAEAIITEVRGIYFRSLCEALGESHDGLASAARAGRRHGVMPGDRKEVARLTKMLVQLDTTFRMNRHANRADIDAARNLADTFLPRKVPRAQARF